MTRGCTSAFDCLDLEQGPYINYWGYAKLSRGKSLINQNTCVLLAKFEIEGRGAVGDSRVS